MYYLNNNYKGTCIIIILFIELQETNKIGLHKNFITLGHNLKIIIKARQKIKKMLYLQQT